MNTLFPDLSSALITLSLTLLPVILWIWALTDAIKNSKRSKEPLGSWLLIILLFPIIGSILYFMIGRNRLKNKRVFNPNFN